MASALFFFLASRLLTTGWVEGRVDQCFCRGEERGGVVAKGEFLEDVRQVESLPLLFDVGNWWGGNETLLPQDLFSLYGQMGYRGIGLGPIETTVDPASWTESFLGSPVPFVLTGSQAEGVQTHLLLPWEGEMLLVLVLVDPLDAHPAWFLPPPREGMERVLSENAGIFDSVVVVSWLDTFQLRDILALIPQKFDLVIEGQYDFEGVEEMWNGTVLIGVDRCSRFQFATRERMEGLEGTTDRWYRETVDLGWGYADDPSPDLLFPEESLRASDPTVSPALCTVCHTGVIERHQDGGTEKSAGCSRCHGEGWRHLMDALKNEKMKEKEDGIE